MVNPLILFSLIKKKPKRKKREREEKPEKQKLVIKISEDKEREIQVSTQTTFWSADGRQVSAQEFLQELYGELPRSLDQKMSYVKYGVSL